MSDAEHPILNVDFTSRRDRLPRIPQKIANLANASFAKEW